ncbi:MAG: hypothetical protein ABSA02_39320 [Trebonia sp.]
MTATAAPAPTPNNTSATAINLGAFTCGDSASVTGDNNSGTSAWYLVTFLGGPCTLNAQLSGNTGDQIDVDNADLQVISGPGNPEAITAVGDYLIDVSGGTSGTTFTLTFSTS